MLVRVQQHITTSRNLIANKLGHQGNIEHQGMFAYFFVGFVKNDWIKKDIAIPITRIAMVILSRCGVSGTQASVFSSQYRRYMDNRNGVKATIILNALKACCFK
jgi:hypothetical protein|tara:strand:+ start:15190 stop:15501 length:312 start_codon:yes stop_codon:yes gene_type:complete